jgi:hypothetical protein
MPDFVAFFMSSYGSLCDDFYIDMHINTELALPSGRDTLLAFFERMQKQFPTMGNFCRRENGEYSLEEGTESGQYRWVTVENNRLGAGYVNPPAFEDAYVLDRQVLQTAPYMLGLSHLDVDSLDVTFMMDFIYEGNHDEIIAEALFDRTPLGCLLDLSNSKAIGFSPSVITALSEDCRLQARIGVESRTSAYEVRNAKFRADEPISLYLTIRQYPRSDEKFDIMASFGKQCKIAEELMASKILPNFVRPLANAISHRR